MAVLVRYFVFLCVLKVGSSHPTGFWPEYFDNDNSSTNTIDFIFEDYSALPGADSLLGTAQDDDLVSKAGENIEGETAVISLDTARDDGSSVGDNLEEDTADETSSAASVETTLAVQDASSTASSGEDFNNTTQSSTTTDVAELTTKPQNSTSTTPSTKPPQENPKKTWAETFIDTVKRFLSLMRDKITDTVVFAKRLFHRLC